jgi:hypothetical protein
MAPQATPTRAADKAEPSRPEDPLTAMARHWLGFYQQVAGWMPGGLASVALFCDARQLQRRWFTELARSYDAFLRTPSVLELWRRNLMAMTKPPHVPPRPPR